MKKFTDGQMQEFFNFLLELRDSAETNMWGASPYIVSNFGVTHPEAQYILVEWIKSFDA